MQTYIYNIYIYIYRDSQHSRVHSRQFLAKNILLEEEIDIEGTWSSIFLQLDLVMVFSMMKALMRHVRQWSNTLNSMVL